MEEKKRVRLEKLNENDLVFDLREPIFANSIMFNGEIISDLFDVGGGFVAFNIAAGKDKEEFPLVLVSGDYNIISKELKKGDKIAGIGHLKKLQGQFVAEAIQVNRMPTKEELDKLSWFFP